MRWVLTVFDWVAGAAITFMLAVVSASILTRIVYGMTGGGINLMFGSGIELASYSLLVVIFAAFPRAASDGLVNVDLFTEKFPEWVNALLDRFWSLILAGIALLIARAAWSQVGMTINRGDETQDLGMSLYLFYGYMAFACLALALVAAWVAVRRSGFAGSSRNQIEEL